MKRRLLRLIVAFGLLLTVAAAAMWVRGFFATDRIGLQRGSPFDDGDYIALRFQRTGIAFVVMSARSPVRLSVTPAEALPPLPPWSYLWDVGRVPDTEYLLNSSLGPDWLRRLGFACEGSLSDGGPGSRYVLIAAPWWFTLLAGGVMTLLALRVMRGPAARRRRRRAAGQCESCGYDLRGADHHRCPECGEPVAADPVGTSV